jgi:antitoxin MazE6
VFSADVRRGGHRRTRLPIDAPEHLPRPTVGYTFGMKTAVSMSDELFLRADELASRLGKSRSEIYREALADYVARREPGPVTRALDELADELTATDAEFVTEAARQTLARSEW